MAKPRTRLPRVSVTSLLITRRSLLAEAIQASRGAAQAATSGKRASVMIRIAIGPLMVVDVVKVAVVALIYNINHAERPVGAQDMFGFGALPPRACGPIPPRYF